MLYERCLIAEPAALPAMEELARGKFSSTLAQISSADTNAGQVSYAGSG
jgi:hypothetical protein